MFAYPAWRKDPMSSLPVYRNILNILIDNINANRSPDLVDSAMIAKKLMLSESEIRHNIHSLRAMGMIESDEEMLRVLITRAGVLWYQQNESTSPLLQP